MLLLAVAVILAYSPLRLVAAPPVQVSEEPKFLGAASCSSSGCHGGGGQNQNQNLVWSLKDFHSQRPFATLTTARSKQIADALRIQDPVADHRCASCHAPLHEIPPGRRGENFQVSEGVSCESCHGPAQGWLRSHTRPDWTHSDRVHAGMRDLQNLIVRANTCVACHQTVAASLLRAGHPELIFELDGQCVSQPRHWREIPGWSGAQTWFVGQAVALREMSWQLSHELEPNAELRSRWSALLWLLQKVDGLHKEFPSLSKIPPEASADNCQATLKACDELAKRASAFSWTEEMSRHALKALASTSREFQQPPGAGHSQARRAERLVLALDRLFISRKASLSAGLADADLNRLFDLSQSIPDFDASKFAAALNQFSRRLAE